LRTAALTQAFQRRLRNLPGPNSGTDLSQGVPILQQQFPGGQLTIVAEIAWGADITQPSATWQWQDVTHDVLLNDGNKITITTGRQDEYTVASPAAVTLRMDNRLGAYSQSVTGPNWPNVQRGVPVRIRYFLNSMEASTGGLHLFQGNVSSFAPHFDQTSQYAVCELQCNGTFRRLSQQGDAIQSTMRLYTPGVTALVAYWPMEDGAGAASFAAATPGTPVLGYAGTPTLANDITMLGSAPLPTLQTMVYTAGQVNGPAGIGQVRVLAAMPSATSGLPDLTALLRVYTTGSIQYWELQYHTGGDLGVVGYSNGTVVFTSGPTTFHIDGLGVQLSLQLQQSGADIAVTYSAYRQNAGTATYATGTAASQTMGAITGVNLVPNGTGTTSIAMGHLTVQGAYTDIMDNSQPVSAYAGEFADARLGRLLVLARAESRGMFTSDTATRMGYQQQDTILNLLREVEATDMGILYDGHDASITGWSHSAIENRATDITLDASAGVLGYPFEPVDDDQQLKNQWTVSQRGGSSAVATDTTSAVGAQEVGAYADSRTVNVFVPVSTTAVGAFGDKAVIDRAYWLLHQGTVQGYRFPTLAIDFHRAPQLLSSFTSIHTTGLGRIDITNIAAVYPQLSSIGTLQLLTVGAKHVIDQFTWHAEYNCVPAEQWRVAVVAANSGDTGANVARLDTSGSVLVSDVAAGAGSMTVATTVGPIWTTDPDDFPLQVNILGMPVTVTNITGSSSPQTFTVTGATVLALLPAGSAVSVWLPPVLAIGSTT
jgi:hypothetical protein